MPAQGLDTLVRKEYLNGEIAGIKLFCAMPGLILEDFQEQYDALKGEINDDDQN